MASVPPAAMAQKEILKAPGHEQCPLGYVNTLGTTCVSPIYYKVAPTYGKACKSGWMNIGAGYCKKKTLGIEELPDAKHSRLGWFSLGLCVMSALLLVATAHGAAVHHS